MSRCARWTGSVWKLQNMQNSELSELSERVLSNAYGVDARFRKRSPKLQGNEVDIMVAIMSMPKAKELLDVFR